MYNYASGMSVWHRGYKPRRSGTQNSDVTLILQGENSVIMKEGFKYSSDGNNNSFKALSDDCPELELNNAIDKITNYFGTKVKDPAGTYQYDKNGNIIYDPTKAMTFEYNHFNLPYSVEDIHKKTIEWLYTADGRKLKKISFGSPEKKYLGNMEFVGGTLDAVYHTEGQVAIDGTSQEWRYAISDHLGNRRILMDDSNTILSESHYYPFGLEMYGTWNANSTFPDDSPENDYKYNGKELNSDFGLGLYDYGARFYDPSIARFTAVDPLAHEMPSWSPYNYTFNNPINLIDPDGRKPEWPIYGKSGKIVGYVVEPGQGPTQIAQDLNQNYGCELSCSAEFSQIVYDNAGQFQNVFDGDGNIDDKYNGDYKSGNIQPGDILEITNGKDPGIVEKIDVLTKSIDSLGDLIHESSELSKTWDALREVFDGEDYKDGGPGATIGAGLHSARNESDSVNMVKEQKPLIQKRDSLEGVLDQKNN